MKLIKFIDRFIPAEIHQDFTRQSRARIIVASGILLLTTMLTLVIPFSILTQSIGTIVLNFFVAVIFLSTTIVMKKTGSILISGNAILVVGYTLIIVGIFGTGGIESRTMYSFTTIILFAYLMTGLGAGVFWTAIIFTTLIAVLIMTATGYDFGSMNLGYSANASISTIFVMTTIIAVLFELTVRNNTRKFEEQRTLSLRTSEDQQKLLDNTNHVMDAVANGDLTKEITVNIEGELGQLKNTVNKALGVLSTTLFKVVTDSTKILAASIELNKASQQIAEGTSQQAASLEEISSSINEIDSVAQNNEENASQAQQLSNQAMTETARSNEQMDAMLNSMQQINDTSGSVSKVIKVIDEIAFQTNLLALNAAVEAARAGKYGKGFAVVAEEVRNLASRSSEAAKNTTTLIESSINEVDNGVKNADQTAEILKTFISSIEKVNDLVGEISASSREQSTGVGEISKSLNLVNEVVQNNSSISEETASASVELKAQAESLQNMMNRFKLKGQKQEAMDGVKENDVTLITAKQRSEPRLIQEVPKHIQLQPADKPRQIILDDNGFRKS